MPTPFVGPPDELSGLTMFLDSQRDAILRKTEGVSDDDAKRAATASSLSLFSIVKHLAYVERRWFQNAVAGNEIPGLWPPTDPTEEVEVRGDETIGSVRALYELRIAESQSITRDAADPSAPAHPSAEGLNLRWVLLHMIEETARHAGHADVIREAIDGQRGV
ncbi:MAG TPA: DinB family protein [Acidimicrobiales bacterium]|nr:DinB family protein [Acidimicrobiales bacterium]